MKQMPTQSFEISGNRETQIRECVNRLLCGWTEDRLRENGYGEAAIKISLERLEKIKT
mgnify:CR=1 FL=1